MKNENLRSKIINTAAMELDFPVCDADINQMAVELDLIPDEEWYWCTFRNSYLICLYGNEDINNKEEMYWLPAAQYCQTLKNLTEEFIFPMTTKRPRVIVIRTFPGMEMKEHTDCNEDQLAKLEPKLRLVVKGRENNTLYFKNENNDQVHISENWRSYIMSGAALHGMKNVGTEKYTICWGDPWTGDDLTNEKFVRYMEEQFKNHEHESITFSSLGNVEHAAGVKNPKIEKIYSWKEWNEHKKD